MAKKNGKSNGVKVEYRVEAEVQNTKNFHKLIIPGQALGEAIRWRQTVYLPGQKRGKSLRSFKKAIVTILLE